jgi:hypothetical protein
MVKVMPRRGDVFGRLTLLEPAPAPDGTNRINWRVQCECGTIKVVRESNMTKASPTVSCGCHHRELTTNRNTTHGHSRQGRHTSEYMAWASMKNRCKPSSPDRLRYYDRGITVCPEWLASFETFLADMGPKPGRGYSLDRVDNDRGYDSGNCRWATASEQAKNRRRGPRGPRSPYGPRKARKANE